MEEIETKYIETEEPEIKGSKDEEIVFVIVLQFWDSCNYSVINIKDGVGDDIPIKFEKYFELEDNKTVDDIIHSSKFYKYLIKILGFKKVKSIDKIDFGYTDDENLVIINYIRLIKYEKETIQSEGSTTH